MNEYKVTIKMYVDAEDEAEAKLIACEDLTETLVKRDSLREAFALMEVEYANRDRY